MGSMEGKRTRTRTWAFVLRDVMLHAILRLVSHGHGLIFRPCWLVHAGNFFASLRRTNVTNLEGIEIGIDKEQHACFSPDQGTGLYSFRAETAANSPNAPAML